jgi:hypothetical protein
VNQHLTTTIQGQAPEEMAMAITEEIEGEEASEIFA